MLVAVLAEKGGVGKTIIATNLAGMRAHGGGPVLLVNGDRQGSADLWGRYREETDLPRVECVSQYGPALGRFLETRVDRYADVVVDLGPRAGVEMTDSLRLADIAVIPVRPCAFDVYTMRLVDNLVREAREHNPGLRALALINQASTNHLSQEADQTRDVILGGCSGLEVAGSVVGQRVAFQRASSVGRTVSEFRQGNGPGGQGDGGSLQGGVRGRVQAGEPRACRLIQRIRKGNDQ